MILFSQVTGTTDNKYFGPVLVEELVFLSVNNNNDQTISTTPDDGGSEVSKSYWYRVETKILNCCGNFKWIFNGSILIVEQFNIMVE